MANLRQIRRRIRSVQNTAKVTKAMEMVAASKMRRAQQRVLAGRPYSERLRELMSHLAAQIGPEETPPLLQARPVKKIAVLFVTPDRGLCGGLTGNINRAMAQFLTDRNTPSTVITAGKKGTDFVVRYGQEVRAVFSGLGDRPGIMDTLPMSRLLMEDFAQGVVDEVYLGYSEFVNTTLQRPVFRLLLPIEPALVEAGKKVGYIYEPDLPGVLDSLLPRFVEMQVFHAILESIASEQSARMVAMRNATESAKEMIEALTLHMNKVRQETITKELLEIVGGASALVG